LSKNTKMVFVTAGMGGGTGTGAAPVIAQACREAGYLTVGIVTIPFRNEGRRRIKQAAEGISKLEGFVDSLLVINNERIREMYGDCGISEAFAKADNVLATAAKGIAEIITVPGYINVDFADVETVMRNSGFAIMGTGIAHGENRAKDAVEQALNSPLLNNNDIRGAKNILLNMTSGNKEVTMDEIGYVTDYVQNKAGFDADIIWGNGTEESLKDNISVTVIATGFSKSPIPEYHKKPQAEKESLPQNKESNLKKSPEKHNTSTISNSPQKTFTFNLQEEKKKEDDDFESLYPSTSKHRESTTNPNIIADFESLTEEDVDDIENIPAYQRRQIRMNDPKYKKQVSKLSVNSNHSGTFSILYRNGYS